MRNNSENELKISLELKTAIEKECGNRCTICGKPPPLYIKNFLQRKITKKSTADNFIGLCPECCEKVKTNQWSRIELIEFKNESWIKINNIDPIDNTTIPVLLKLDIACEDGICTERHAKFIRHAFADYLQTKIAHVIIIKCEYGSSKFTLILLISDFYIDRLNEHIKIKSILKPFRMTYIHPDQKNSQDSNTWVDIGSKLAEIDRLNDAVKCYNRALQLDSGNPKAWLKKSEVLVKLDRLDEASVCIIKAIKITPDYLLELYNTEYFLEKVRDRKAYILTRNEIIRKSITLEYPDIESFALSLKNGGAYV